MLRRLFRKSPPWYAGGYIKFPEQVDSISIVVGERIITINNTQQTVTISENTGTYFNTDLQVIKL